ncbi:hypothetical protein [Nonomuraea sp. NPDC005501]|uniref:hypothetical protein n=1 Tax=Nonomuraea sp. NPDC005501 TaxID=3156884 RepID=UPI0033A95AF8
MQEIEFRPGSDHEEIVIDGIPLLDLVRAAELRIATAGLPDPLPGSARLIPLSGCLDERRLSLLVRATLQRSLGADDVAERLAAEGTVEDVGWLGDLSCRRAAAATSRTWQAGATPPGIAGTRRRRCGSAIPGSTSQRTATSSC